MGVWAVVSGAHREPTVPTLHRMGFRVSEDGNSGIYLPILRITYYREKACGISSRDAEL